MTIIAAGSAVRSPGVRLAMAGIAAVVLAADQVTKSLVLAGHPADGTSLGWVTVRLARNTGASGGIASGYQVLVTLAALAVTALAAGLAVRVSSRGAALCLAAVLGGAYGNLSDRLFRSPGFGRGGVVDWIHLGPGGGSLDLADLAIQFGVLGAIIAMVAAERTRTTREARQQEQPGLSVAPPAWRRRSGCGLGACGDVEAGEDDRG
jgi:signal peptidase II